MARGPAAWLRTVYRRLRRLERREFRAFRRQLETTRTLVHLSILVVLPLLIAAVTFLSNAVSQLSFLLFPPLAAGSYTLFAHPESRYASPRRFVGGLTAGAICGWAALQVDAMLVGAPPGQLRVGALAAGLCIFLVAAVTWAFDLEEPAAYSTALLALLVPSGSQLAFTASVLVSTALVAAAFVLWRDRFYERRAEILYETTTGDDRILVPMVGPDPDATAMLAGRLAAAHDGGKVVLLDVVADEAVARAERDHLEHAVRAATDAPDAAAGETEPGAGQPATEDADTVVETVATAAQTIETQAQRIERETGVPCQVVVVANGSDLSGTIARAARTANCDVLAVPYLAEDGALASHVQRLFRTEFDVVVHRSVAGRTTWARVLVPVRGVSDVSHAMLEFATRLVGESGRISVSHCLGDAGDRRRAEAMLADLVEPYAGHIETRVARLDIETYLAETAGDYDLVIVGASRDRSTASRLVSRPTFERIQDIDSDVAIVDRN